MRRFIRLAGAVVVVLCASVLWAHTTHAAPNQGPDPADFTASTRYGNSYSSARTVDYAVATSAYNTILTNTLNIYLPSPSGTIVVHNVNICYNTFRNGGRNYDQIDDGHNNSSGNATSFKIGSNTQWGAFSGSSTCDNVTKSFAVSGATLDPNTNMYKYQLVAHANPATDKYTNTFWITAPSGSYVSQDSSQPTSSFGMEQTSPIPSGNNPDNDQTPPDPYRDYANYLIRFAPDCTLTSGSVTKQIEIFDDDNFNNWDVQPKPFLIKLVEIDDTTGAQTTVPLSISFPDGSGSLSGPDGSGYYTAGTTANAKRTFVKFTAKYGKKYQWLVDSVYYDNTLQFKLPYDSVYYYTGCAKPAATLKAGMTASPGTMSQDDTATFTPSISVASYRSALTANCTVTRTFYPASGGSQNIGNQPCLTAGGGSGIPITGNGTITLKSNTYNAPNSAVPGSRICDTITITNPSDSKYYADPDDNTSTSCVTITKTPYVHFTGGDVWAGGGFASIDPSCDTSAKITTAAPSATLGDGNYAGSGSAYAAFALDKITNFGSASAALIGGAGDAWTFGNINSGNLGFYGAPQHCINDWSGLFGSAAALAGGSTIDVGSQGSGTWHTTGSLTIHGTMPAGSKQVYVVDGDVDIDADLKYPDAFGNTADIPSLVIISKHNVHAWAATTQIDGIIEAIGNGSSTGIFYTCWPKPAQETISTCASNLTINGSVMSAGLDLYRTAGNDGNTPASRKVPAEKFNLSPEVYITNALNGSSTQSVTTNNVRELAPRF